MSQRRDWPTSLLLTLALLVLLGLLAAVGLFRMLRFYFEMPSMGEVEGLPGWVHLMALSMLLQVCACGFGIWRILSARGNRSDFDGATIAVSVMLAVQLLRLGLDVAHVPLSQLPWWTWILRLLIAVLLVVSLVHVFRGSSWSPQASRPGAGST